MLINSLSFAATQALVFPRAVYTTLKNVGEAHETFATQTKEEAVNKIALLRVIGFSAALWATASVVTPIPLIGWAATFLPTASPFSGLFPMMWTVSTFVTGHDLLRLAQNKEDCNLLLATRDAKVADLWKETFTGPVLTSINNKVILVKTAVTEAAERLNPVVTMIKNLFTTQPQQPA